MKKMNFSKKHTHTHTSCYLRLKNNQERHIETKNTVVVHFLILCRKKDWGKSDLVLSSRNLMRETGLEWDEGKTRMQCRKMETPLLSLLWEPCIVHLSLSSLSLSTSLASKSEKQWASQILFLSSLFSSLYLISILSMCVLISTILCVLYVPAFILFFIQCIQLYIATIFSF